MKKDIKIGCLSSIKNNYILKWIKGIVDRIICKVIKYEKYFFLNFRLMIYNLNLFIDTIKVTYCNNNGRESMTDLVVMGHIRWDELLYFYVLLYI